MKRVLVTVALTLFLYQGKTAEKPHLILIQADDLGYCDLGCFGTPDIKTPHLDKLTKGGMRFTAHYANSSSCSPTRAAFITDPDLEQRSLFFKRAPDPHRNKAMAQRAVRMGDWKYLEADSGERFLFNLKTNTAESTNLVALETSRAAEMQSALDRWEADVEPPLYDQRSQALINKANRTNH